MVSKSSHEAGGESLPASCRIKRSEDFKKVQDSGQRVASGLFVMLWLGNGLGLRRLGVTVSSRVGNSVVRNRLKRTFREIFRKNRERLPSSIDLVMIARSGAPEAEFSELLREFERLAERVRKKGR